MWLLIPTPFFRSPPVGVALTLPSRLQFRELARCVTWKGTFRPPESWRRAWQQGNFPPLLSGVISKPSVAARGAAAYRRSLPACLASPTPLRGSAPAIQTSERSGPRSSEWWEKFCPQLSFSKMFPNFCATSDPLEPDYQTWVTELRSHCTEQRKKQARATRESESLSWLTAVRRDAKEPGARPDLKKWGRILATEATSWPTPRTITGGAESADPKKEFGRLESDGGDLQAAVSLWQTPAADSFRSRGGERVDEMGLDQQARAFPTANWPTPDAGVSTQTNRSLSDGAAVRPLLAKCVQDWPTPRANAVGSTRTRKRTPRKDGRILDQEAETWPTPAARDHRTPNLKTYEERGGMTKGEQLQNFVEHNFPLFLPDQADGRLVITDQPRLTPTPASGSASSPPDPTSRQPSPRRLNAAFVEWLMGWPPGWTCACYANAAGEPGSRSSGKASYLWQQRRLLLSFADGAEF